MTEQEELKFAHPPSPAAANSGLKHGCRIHVSRCHRIKTTVHLLDKTAEHEFPPGARVGSVKEWAVTSLSVLACARASSHRP